MFEEELNEILNSEMQAYSLLKYLNDKNFEEEIVSFTKNGFHDALYSSFPSKESKKLVMLGLTFIALKYYDGSLWPHVYEKFSDLYQDQKILESKIRDKVLGLLTSKYNCERKHYQIPVMNSIVPFYYASNYIEFANDIYVKNMDCNISFYNIEEEIENVFNSISDSLTDSDDSFKYNYEQNNSKTYKLIKATKNIIKSKFKRKELILLTKDIIKKLDNFYNGKKNSVNYYIDEAFNKWIKETEDNERLKTKNNTNFIKSKFPYFTFLNNNGCIYLHTPTKRLFGYYEPQKFSMEILENDNVIYQSNNLKINQLLGGSEIIQHNQKIDNPLNKIRCKIYYNQEVVYDSKDLLYRDYLLFNDDKELKNNKSYNGLVYFIYKNSCDFKLRKLKEYDFYKISYSTVCENEEYILDNKYNISFSNTIKPGIIGNKILGLELIEYNDLIPIYIEIDKICLTSYNTNKFANRIKINGEFIDSVEFVEILEQPNALAYILDINKLYLKTDFYIIELVDIQQNKTFCKYKFLYDSDIDIQQVISNEFSISVRYSGFFEMIDRANRKYTEFILDINDLDKKKLYLNIDNYLYKCKFSLTIPFYRIDDGSAYIFSHNITSEDFSAQSKLFFNNINCDKVIYRADNIINELTIKTIQSEQYIELSEFFNLKKCKLIELSFSFDGIEKQYLKIYNDVVFNAEESYYSVDFRNEEIQFKTVFNGIKTTDNIYIQIKNRYGIIAEEVIDEFNNLNVFKLGNKIQKIHYCVYRKVKKYLGFKIIDNQEILDEGDFAYYPLVSLIKKYLVIDKVFIQRNEDDLEMMNTYNLNLRIVKRFSDFYFLGFLYKNNNGQMQAFDKIGAVLINLSQVYLTNNNYCCDADISIYYEDSFDENPWLDYLQYDKNNRTLMNGYSKNAPYISKYRINLTLGEKQYADFKSNRES